MGKNLSHFKNVGANMWVVFFFLNGQILITSYQKQVIKHNGSNSISNNSKAKLLIQHNCREIYVFQIVLENILEHTSGHFPLWIS